jgi:hypothetical protein
MKHPGASRPQLSKEVFVITSKVRGRIVVRFSICSHRTTLEDIDRVFIHIERIGISKFESAALKA